MSHKMLSRDFRRDLLPTGTRRIIPTVERTGALQRIAMLTGLQFDRTRRLALSLAGSELAERHRELLHRRSRRLGIRDDAGLDPLLNAAKQGKQTATQKFLCLLTTKCPGFFRPSRHFEMARTPNSERQRSAKGRAVDANA